MNANELNKRVTNINDGSLRNTLHITGLTNKNVGCDSARIGIRPINQWRECGLFRVGCCLRSQKDNGENCAVSNGWNSCPWEKTV